MMKERHIVYLLFYLSLSCSKQTLLCVFLSVQVGLIVSEKTFVRPLATENNLERFIHVHYFTVETLLSLFP